MNIKLIIIFLLIVSSVNVFTKSNLDSIFDFINNGPQERKSYYMAEYILISPNPSLYREIAFESLSLALKSKNYENTALANFAVGRYFLFAYYNDMNKSNLKDSAKYYLSKAVKQSNYLINKQYVANLFSNYAYVIDSHEKLIYYEKAQNLFTELKQLDKADRILNKKFHVHLELQELQKADSLARFLLNKDLNSGKKETLNDLFDIVKSYDEFGCYELAMKLMNDYRKLINNNTKENQAWNFFYSLSIAEWNYGHYIEALKNCDTSLIYAQISKNLNDLTLSYELRGIIYHSIKIWNEAENSYKQALTFAKKMSNDTIISRVWMNIATMYMDYGYYHKAVNILSANKSIYIKSYQNFRPDYCLAYLFNISECYFYLRDIANSKAVIDELKDENVEAYSVRINIIYYLALGRYAYLVRDYNHAELYLKKALSFAKMTNNYAQTKTILDILPDVMKKQGNLNEAYEYLTLWSITKDSVNASINNREMGIYEAKKEIEFENQKRNAEKLLDDAQIQTQNLIIYMMIIAAVILIVFAGVIFKQRMNSEKLLLNILPKQIAKRLKKKEKYIAERFNDASVIFIDIANFTKLSSGIQPERLVEILNDIFTIFDNLTEKYGLEKIKTIGDCYLAASGIPEPRLDHSIAAANMAIESMKIIKEYKTFDGLNITFRIGIDCGPIVAGIIGKKKFIYDLWGDTVNTASRMEDYGVIGEIQVSGRFKKEIDMMSSKFNNNFTFVDRGVIEMKGKGQMHTWLLRELE